MKLTVVIAPGASIGTVKVIVPDTAPLFVTPEAYAFAVPYLKVFIKKGCPAVDMLKV
jgi:hypothetical protein